LGVGLKESGVYCWVWYCCKSCVLKKRMTLMVSQSSDHASLIWDGKFIEPIMRQGNKIKIPDLASNHQEMASIAELMGLWGQQFEMDGTKLTSIV